jgi:hypothetical protein
MCKFFFNIRTERAVRLMWGRVCFTLHPAPLCISFIHGKFLIIGYFLSFIITMTPVGNLEKLKCAACNF